MAKQLIIMIAAVVLIAVASVLLIVEDGTKSVPAVAEQMEVDTPSVTLTGILKDPESFADKRITINSFYGSKCCEGCFILKEGTESMEFFYSTDLKNLKPGTPLAVTGILSVKKQEDGENIITVQADKVEKR